MNSLGKRQNMLMEGYQKEIQLLVEALKRMSQDEKVEMDELELEEERGFEKKRLLDSGHPWLDFMLLSTQVAV